jgi:Leucine-rich repeat (LRR) protein
MKAFIFLLLNFGLAFGDYCFNNQAKEYDGLGTYDIEGCANTEIFMMKYKFSNDSIKILKARRNKIDKLDYEDFAVMYNVEEVDLSENRITAVDDRIIFINCKEIKKLNLSKNKIAELDYSPFAYLQDLETLDLSDNQLTEIKRATFKNLLELQVINLSKNKISRIEMSAITNVPKLQNLDLMENVCIDESFEFKNEDEVDAFNEKLIISNCTILCAGSVRT